MYRRVWGGQLQAVRVGEHGPLRFRSEAVEALLRPVQPVEEERPT